MSGRGRKEAVLRTSNLRLKKRQIQRQVSVRAISGLFSRLGPVTSMVLGFLALTSLYVASYSNNLGKEFLPLLDARFILSLSFPFTVFFVTLGLVIRAGSFTNNALTDVARALLSKSLWLGRAKINSFDNAAGFSLFVLCFLSASTSQPFISLMLSPYFMLCSFR